MSRTLQRSKTPSGAAFVDIHDASGEPVVLLHGVGMRIEAWQPQIDFLSRTHRVVAVDLPGHGCSSPLAGQPALGDYVTWFHRFAAELGLPAMNLVGHSMGALIATGVAATAPATLKRVALLNGVHRRTPEARSAVEARATEITSGLFDPQAPLQRWFEEEEKSSEAYALVSDLLRSVDAEGYAAAYRAFSTGDSVYSGYWGEIRCPALFLTGEGDRNSTSEMAEEMARAAPHGRVAVIAGHRHMVNLTAPDEVNRILADWLTWEEEGND